MLNPTPPTPKVALVTGAFSGIGLASAVRLAQAGWTVYGTGRNLAKGENLLVLGRLSLAPANAGNLVVRIAPEDES